MRIPSFITDTFCRVGTAISAASIQLYTKINCRGDICSNFNTEVVLQNGTGILNPHSCLQACKNSFEVIGELGKKIIFKGPFLEDLFVSHYGRSAYNDDEFQPERCFQVCGQAIEKTSSEDAQIIFSKHALLIPCIGFVAMVDAVFKRAVKQKEWKRLAFGTALAGAMSIPTGVAVLDCMAAYWWYKAFHKIIEVSIQKRK